jgi:hypothetical protein
MIKPPIDLFSACCCFYLIFNNNRAIIESFSANYALKFEHKYQYENVSKKMYLCG